MAVEFKLPDLGENVESADVLDVLVSPGDRVEKEQPVLETETEKATMEIPSTMAGTVKEIKVSKGDTIKVGQTILVFEDDGEAAGDSGDKKADAKAEKPAEPEKKAEKKAEPKAEPAGDGGGGGGTVEFKLPDLGENVESADVLDVLVSVGDKIEKEQPVLEAETEKATMEIPSNVSGTVKEIKVSKGDTVKVGQAVLVVESADAAPAKEAPKQEAAPSRESEADAQQRKAEPKETGAPVAVSPDAPKTGVETSPPPSTPEGERPPVAAAPSVRQFAREIGVDIYQVKGTGPGGRISIDDVKNHARTNRSAGGSAAAPGAAAGPRSEREPMSKIRKVTARHMAKAWETIPHVTIHDKADVTDVEAMRQRFKKKAEQAGGKLTITAIFVKIVAAALRSFPSVNASIDTEASEIEYKKYYNIGVAVDTPRGLVVPVIRDADKKSIFDIAKELTEISGKARDGKLSLEDMQGGTFTITNLGSIGTGFFTPIVNHPEVGILGMGRALQEPVFKNGEFIPRLMAPLSLSFDHRLVDGADGARFLRWIVDAVENPLMLSFEN